MYLRDEAETEIQTDRQGGRERERWQRNVSGGPAVSEGTNRAPEQVSAVVQAPCWSAGVTNLALLTNTPAQRQGCVKSCVYERVSERECVLPRPVLLHASGIGIRLDGLILLLHL